MSTRKELELRIEELLASEARLIARVAELEGYEIEPEHDDQRSTPAPKSRMVLAMACTPVVIEQLVECEPSDMRGLMRPTTE